MRLPRDTNNGRACHMMHITRRNNEPPDKMHVRWCLGSVMDAVDTYSKLAQILGGLQHPAKRRRRETGNLRYYYRKHLLKYYE